MWVSAHVRMCLSVSLSDVYTISVCLAASGVFVSVFVSDVCAVCECALETTVVVCFLRS